MTLNIQRMSYALMPLSGYPVTYEELDLDYLDDFPWEVKMMAAEVSKKCLEMAKEADADYIRKAVLDEYAEGEKNYFLIAPEYVMGYTNHKWGPFPAHYTDEFYTTIGKQIKQWLEK